jgi:hypothetical protein
MMNPASIQALLDAQATGQQQGSDYANTQPDGGIPGQAQGDPDEDPDMEKVTSGIFGMTPDELDVLDQMIQQARARLTKGDPGGNIKL